MQLNVSTLGNSWPLLVCSPTFSWPVGRLCCKVSSSLHLQPLVWGLNVRFETIVNQDNTNRQSTGSRSVWNGDASPHLSRLVTGAAEQTATVVLWKTVAVVATLHHRSWLSKHPSNPRLRHFKIRWNHLPFLPASSRACLVQAMAFPNRHQVHFPTSTSSPSCFARASSVRFDPAHAAERSLSDFKWIQHRWTKGHLEASFIIILYNQKELNR